jgi:hypothetical protein
MKDRWPESIALPHHINKLFRDNSLPPCVVVCGVDPGVATGAGIDVVAVPISTIVPQEVHIR